MRRTCWCFVMQIVLAFGVPVAEAAGQERPSTFEICQEYVSAFETLQKQADAHQDVADKLIGERRETFNRLLETKGTINTLIGQRRLGQMKLLETEMEAIMTSASLNPTFPEAQSGSLQRIDPQSTALLTLKQISARVTAQSQFSLQRLADLQVQMDELEHSLKTVNKAGSLAVQRYMSIMQEMRKIAEEMMTWQTESTQLFHAYWELADVEGVKSHLELRGALRTLEQASKLNVGATFARVITLTRLGEYDEALETLNDLVQIPAMHTIALAARAEILARQGKKKESRMDLTKTLPTGTNNAAVRMHRAQAFAALGDFRQAEREWEAVLKLGGHEIAARRAIALINASATKANPKTKAKASENAFLAVQLAGDDWASEAAMALAAAANGEKAESLAAVERASQLAIGNNQLLCDQLKQKIDAGIPVCWQF